MNPKLTTKLVAGYVELANKYLDQIPVENTSDFAVIAEALKSITDSNPPHEVPNSLKDRITDLKDIIDNPDMYVQKKEHYEEFKNIILSRVAAKINELNQLTSTEQERAMDETIKKKTESKQNKDLMAKRKPPAPNSEAHTISEQEMLAELQRQFRSAGSYPYGLRELREPLRRDIAIERIRNIDHGNLFLPFQPQLRLSPIDIERILQSDLEQQNIVQRVVAYITNFINSIRGE